MWPEEGWLHVTLKNINFGHFQFIVLYIVTGRRTHVKNLAVEGEEDITEHLRGLGGPSENIC